MVDDRVGSAYLILDCHWLTVMRQIDQIETDKHRTVTEGSKIFVQEVTNIVKLDNVESIDAHQSQ